MQSAGRTRQDHQDFMDFNVFYVENKSRTHTHTPGKHIIILLIFLKILIVFLNKSAHFIGVCSCDLKDNVTVKSSS